MKKSTEVSQHIPGFPPQGEAIVIRAAELMALINSVPNDVLEVLRLNGVTESLLIQSLTKIQGIKKD